VADFRDPWISGDQSSSYLKAGWWEPRAEAAVVRGADAIILNTPRAREQLASAYPQHAAKMVAISNGYDPETFQANPIPPCSHEVVEIIHAGQVYANRDPAPFLEAVRGWAAEFGSDPQRLRIRFLGCEGDRAELVGRHAREASVSHLVSVSGIMPHAEALRAMCQADILLLLDSPGRMGGVPAKLYEYLGAGRPILALAEPNSDVDWVLRRSGAVHRLAPPRDSQAIRRALVELTTQSSSLLKGQTNRPGPLPFTRMALAAELANLLDRCVLEVSSGVRAKSTSPSRSTA
jgi:glycosyltransferase involved in cell wall biosynthesis